MKKALLFILFTATLTSAQSQRYDSFAATLTSASGIGNITQVIPNATITVFNQPAAGVNCAAGGCVAATTFTSRTGITACGGGLPLTRPTSATCIATADSAGNFGFWAAAGAYQYCVAATSITTQCFNVALGAPIDGLFTGIYYPTLCGTSNPPSWCAGSDLGAWVNAAATACTTCRIQIPSGACISYTTPISFGSGQFVTLQGIPGGSSCIKFTPTTGTAITFDPGTSEHTVFGIRDLQLIGATNGNTLATVGVQMGNVNGAEGFLISGFKTATSCCTNDGFGVGIQQGTGTSFLGTIEKSGIYSNGIGIKQQGANENTRILSSSISNNTTNAIVMGTGATNDLFISGTSFDGNGVPTISMPANTSGAGSILTSTENHFENPPSGTTAANGYIDVGNNDTAIVVGGVMLDDRTTSTNTTGMIRCAGTSNVQVYGVMRATGGITVNPFILPSGSCRISMRNSFNVGTFTDFPAAYTGGTIDYVAGGFANTVFQFLNGAQSANTYFPFGSNVTTGLTGNMGSTQLGAATNTAGIYLVCMALFPTVTGTATAIQATVSSNDGNAYTLNVGPVLSTAALTNVASGCLPIPAGSGVTINVATTGYSGTGTYTVRSEVNEIQ